MLGRAVAATSLAVVVVLAALPPAAAQVEPVEFRIALGNREILSYSVVTALGVVIDFGFTRQTIISQGTGREVVRVLDVEQDGALLVEQVLEEMRITIQGKTEDVLYGPSTYRVRADGKVVETQTGEALEHFPFAFPGRPVAVNDSWTAQTRYEEAGVRGQVTRTFTLAAIERTDGGRVARVRTRDEGAVTGADTIRGAPGSTVKTTGTIRGTGEILWSVERGRIMQTTDEISIDT